MVDNEMLQAISQIFDEKLKQELAPIKDDLTRIHLTLENDISKKLSALHDGHMLDTEKLKHIFDTVDNIEPSVVALDVMNKVNTDEIIKLKFVK